LTTWEISFRTTKHFILLGISRISIPRVNWDHKIKETEMGMACSTHRRVERGVKTFVRKLEK
jgi:hypothetical protein